MRHNHEQPNYDPKEEEVTKADMTLKPAQEMVHKMVESETPEERDERRTERRFRQAEISQLKEKFQGMGNRQTRRNKIFGRTD